MSWRNSIGPLVRASAIPQSPKYGEAELQRDVGAHSSHIAPSSLAFAEQYTLRRSKHVKASAPAEMSKQKPATKNSFDDELGDDFLSSWKPSKSLAALDFEDDEPVVKNRKASFSLAKMDTSFDFDFDGGLNALSKFNVDMSDLDLPSSCEKSHRKEDSYREKQLHDKNKKNESKFSFEFQGFDELDLDDALKAKKEPENSPYSKKGKRDCSHLSTTSKCLKKGILDSPSDNASESSSIPTDGGSMKKEIHRPWSDSGHDQGEPVGAASFDEDNSAEDSAHELGHPLPEMEEQASDHSDDYTAQKERDDDVKDSTTFPAQANNSACHKSIAANYWSKDSDVETSTAMSAEHTKAVSTTPELHQEPASADGDIETDREPHSEHDVESSKKPPTCMELDGSSSECEMQKLAVDEERIEEFRTRMDVNPSQSPKLPMKNSCRENLMLGILDEPFNDEQQTMKSRQEASSDENFHSKEEKRTNHLCEGEASALHLHDGLRGAMHKSQEAEVEGVDKLIASESNTLPTEVSPASMPAKRKFFGEEMLSESRSSKQSSSKKLEVGDMSKGGEVQEISDSATSEKKFKNLRRNLVEKHQDVLSNPLLCRTALKLADRSSLQKTTALPSLRAPRMLSSTTRLQSTLPSQKKPTVLGRLQTPSLSSVLQSNRNSFQNAAKDASSRILQTRSRPSTEKQLQGAALRRMSGLAVLSKTRVMGTLRESCEKTFKLHFATSKGLSGLQSPHSRKDLASLKDGGDPDKKPALENPDTDMADLQNIEPLEKSCLGNETMQANAAESPMADVQNIENLEEISNMEIVRAKGDGPNLATVDSDAVIIEKAQYYTDHLDQ
ncbi:hypothetical protein GOP47_0004944, partial [Adiantum capillus-veneris]